MNALKGIYRNGLIELIESPDTQETTEVLIIFPDKKKKVSTIGGLFKDNVINYEEVEEELKKLEQNSQIHIIEEAENQE